MPPHPLSPPIIHPQARTLLADTLRVRFRLGEFDPPAGQAWLRYGVNDIHTAADEAAAEDAARQALVLLLNGGAGPAPLPLDAAAASPVAVIGPHGNDTLTLQARRGKRGGEAASALDSAMRPPTPHTHLPSPLPFPRAGLLRRRLLPRRPLDLLLPLHLRSHPGAAGSQRRHRWLRYRRQRLVHVARAAAGAPIR